jgi:hypothetical protein
MTVSWFTHDLRRKHLGLHGGGYRGTESLEGIAPTEIGQQPVKLFQAKSANVLEMPDFIGCLQFFAF